MPPTLACAAIDQFAARTNRLMAVKRTAQTTNVTCLEAIFASPQSDNAGRQCLLNERCYLEDFGSNVLAGFILTLFLLLCLSWSL